MRWWGGRTYELRLARARKLHPVSHIRVVLDKVRILDDHDPWIKGRGELQFTTVVGFNDDPDRRHWSRIPQKGTIKIRDRAPVCLFDGFVTESDRMEISMLPVEKDFLSADDPLRRYHRYFDGPPETWVGQYGPDDEPPAADLERWRIGW